MQVQAPNGPLNVANLSRVLTSVCRLSVVSNSLVGWVSSPGNQGWKIFCDWRKRGL